MKLINFYESKQLNELLVNMGAPLLSIGASNSWNGIDDTKLEELLRTGEVEIEVDEIEIIDGVFEYKGQKVIVYIRDQYFQFYDKGYKFHLTTCSTIIKAFKEKRNSRYVISLRSDGMFKINLFNEDVIVEEGKIEKLKVCKNCLTSISYNGYSGASWNVKTQIYENYDLKEYFMKYRNSSLNKGLFDEADKAPLNTYNEDFHITSKKVKERDSYRCKECNVDMSKKEYRKYAHVHHIDANKSNDYLSNLETLCIECHSNKPGHYRLKNTGDYHDFVSSGLSLQ